MADGSDVRAVRHDAVLNRLHSYIEAVNIADLLEEKELQDLGAKVVTEFEIDERSNDDWFKTAKRSMDVALQVKEQKNYPFPGASNVKYPLITVAALQFNARAYPEIVGGDRIVKAKVVGNDDGVPAMGPDGQPIVDPNTGEPQWQVAPGAKREKADRISEHMSYQLTEEIENWEEDTDTLLMQIPIVGCAFKKVYPDADKKPCDDLIPAIDLYVNRSTKSLRSAPRITQKLPPIYPSDIEERVRDGRWREVVLGTPQNAGGDPDAPHEFLEQHRRIDLDGDGYGEPYVVTVHRDSSQVMRIVANYDAAGVVQGGNGRKQQVTRIKAKNYFVKIGFIPDPKGGFYDIGFGQLLESLGAAIDSSLNQMFDAGHLQNAGGGFIGSGIRLKKNKIELTPGVYKTVDASGATLREAIYNFEHPGPSAVLFQLLGLLIDAAKDITGVKDILVGDSQGKTQTATTTLALIEQGMKVFTAIYKRIYRALKQEFRLLYDLNAENLPAEAYFNVLDTPKAVARTDYSEGTYDICPQADPKLVTDMQRAARAQVLQQFLGIPGANNPAILKRIFVATGQEDPDELIMPMPTAPDPMMVAEVNKTQSEAALNEAKVGQVQAETKGEIAAIVTKGIELKMDAAEMALSHGTGREDAALSHQAGREDAARSDRNAEADRQAALAAAKAKAKKAAA